MNEEQKAIHARALQARKEFHNFELGFIGILQDTERTKLHHAVDKKTVHIYAVDVLGFNDAVAYMFIAVARKAIEVPQLLTSGLSVFVLSRLVSTINPENADELIHIAQTKTSRELDWELGRRNPKHRPERTKILSEECLELTVKVSDQFLDKLKRVQALRAQKNAEAGIGLALEAGLDEYLRKHDPVQKAERAMKRKRDVVVEEKFCAHRIFKRVPLTAAQRHAVFARDQGKCTHVGSSGERCGSDQWIQVHHILEVSRGGGNEPENLTTLCSFHHDQIHQLSFPVVEQATG